jgi:cell division protein FtsB
MNIKNIFTAVFIICIILLIINIFKNSLQIVKAEKRLSLAQKKVETLEKQKFIYLQEQNQRGSQAFIEKQIRDKLKLIKPGESLIVLPPDLQGKTEDNFYQYNFKDDSLVNYQSNWQSWLQLFL